MEKNKFIIIGSSIIGILVLLLVIIWLMSVFRKKNYSYEEVELMISDATKSYYKKYPEMLPVNDGEYTLPYSSLVQANEIKPLNELLEDGDSCNSEIIVVSQSNNYTYIPRLSCAGKYETKELYRQVLEANPVVTSGSGLYQSEDGTYYFKGKITNNYVALGTTGEGKKEKEILWRIISIDKNNNIKIKSTQHTGQKVQFDDRYNEDKKNNSGYNDFETSLIKDYLVSISNNEDFLNEEQKSKLISLPVCTSRRKEDDTSKDGSTECVQNTTTMLFTTMTPYEYMRASLDENCNTTISKSCSNYNFLSKSESLIEWLITSTDENSYQSYIFNGKTFELSNARQRNSIYPVSNISAYALYKSGSGTESDPYRLFASNKNTTKKK